MVVVEAVATVVEAVLEAAPVGVSVEVATTMVALVVDSRTLSGPPKHSLNSRRIFTVKILESPPAQIARSKSTAV